MSTLEEEISATERAVAGAASALAAFWESSAAELGLTVEYVPEPATHHAQTDTAAHGAGSPAAARRTNHGDPPGADFADQGSGRGL